VLVVDAEFDGLVSMQQLLQRDGYVVLTANSLRDALEVLPAHNVVAVIADENLADSSGRELLEYLKGSSAHVARILRIAVDTPGLSARLVESGLVQQVFVKGRDNGILREAMRQVVRRIQSGRVLRTTT
jgi:DNA-binding NtrC family response regulator